MRRHHQKPTKPQRKLPRRGRSGQFVRSGGQKRRKRKNPRRRAAAQQRKRNAKGHFVRGG